MPSQLLPPTSAGNGIRGAIDFLFFCPSCSFIRTLSPRRPLHQARLRKSLRQLPRPRHASTVTPVTAVDKPLDVPPKLHDLRRSIEALKDRAANFVNLSKLELALRGLEAGNAVVRIAVLGVNGRKSAQRLGRLLLADPLSPATRWEERLSSGTTDESKALLLRYGDESEIVPESPLLTTIPFPSPVLQEHNLEILVSVINIESNNIQATTTERPQDAILVPLLETTTSSSGRYTQVTYPVHRALLVGQSIDDAVRYGRYMAADADEALLPDVVKVAIQTSSLDSSETVDATRRVVPVNTALAEDALAQIRESPTNSTKYEHEWLQSGLPSLQEWMLQSSKNEPNAIKPAVRSLISSSLDEATAVLLKQDTERLQSLTTSTPRDSVKQSILISLAAWAERAHSELQQQLSIAFLGRSWSKLTWWKLFWRVDDVTMISSDVLERRWLTEAEKEIVWVSGRIEEAGFLKGAENSPERQALASPSKIEELNPGIEPRFSVEVATFDDDEVKPVELRPWPLQIPQMRNQLRLDTVPRLQALAQRLVVETISTFTLTSALSALIFFSVPSLSAFEAGVVGALGLVFSLRRMQVKWEAASEYWQGELLEEGRKTLKETEESVRGILEYERQPEADIAAAEDRRAAREALEKVRIELAKL